MYGMLHANPAVCLFTLHRHYIYYTDCSQAQQQECRCPMCVSFILSLSFLDNHAMRLLLFSCNICPNKHKMWLTELNFYHGHLRPLTWTLFKICEVSWRQEGTREGLAPWMIWSDFVKRNDLRGPACSNNGRLY